MKTMTATMKKNSHMLMKIVSRGSAEISASMMITYNSMFWLPVRNENIKSNYFKVSLS